GVLRPQPLADARNAAHKHLERGESGSLIDAIGAGPVLGPRAAIHVPASAVRTAPVAPMPDKGDFGLNEEHETTRAGERVLIRPVRPEDTVLYRDFLADVSAEDLRLRFFARIAELSAEEIDKLSHLNYQHEMAFIALDEETGRMLGLVRLKEELDEETSEFAILV